MDEKEYPFIQQLTKGKPVRTEYFVGAYTLVNELRLWLDQQGHSVTTAEVDMQLHHILMRMMP